ncbi:hypothetical protein [Streptomyces sp. AC550_RSS872]|uniref:hypothetical protein n=1 Tax=Streptomyces sp. AC550_RSS872 TaxID=2823689 RepID=UPI0027E4B78D|nr:hypothetical protein [Streptomyces sp. AC550_RSS872]
MRRKIRVRPRTVVAITLSAGVTVVAVTSVDYASASNSASKSAPSVQEAAAYVPQGGDDHSAYGFRNDEPGNDRRDDRGRIHVNERTFSAEPGVCTAVISSPASSFNVRNESDKTVEFFTGITCDNGAAIATIGPRNSSSAIAGTTVTDGVVVPTALVGSFRAIDKHHHHH